MDAYEVHKKIQEAIALVDAYQTLSFHSSQWHGAIKEGLIELSEKRYDLFTTENTTCPMCAGSGRRSLNLKHH